MARLAPLVSLLGCATAAHLPVRRASRPATAAELRAYDLSVRAPSPEERSAFAAELGKAGFHVVPHEPLTRVQLDVSLTREPSSYVATLRSDGFLVDEAVGATPAELAATLAASQRVLDFIRNNGLPQQQLIESGPALTPGRALTPERATEHPAKLAPPQAEPRQCAGLARRSRSAGARGVTSAVSARPSAAASSRGAPCPP